MLPTLALASLLFASSGSPPASPILPVARDSGYVVTHHGGWRGYTLSVGPYKATRVRESGRKQWRSGNFLLGALRERWHVQFDLSDAPDAPPQKTRCGLDRLVKPAAAPRQRLEDERLFGMECSQAGSTAWSLSIDAVHPPSDVSTEHMATHGWTIGSVTADNVQWSVVATGARRVLRYLWTHPRSFELRNADGIVDAAVFVHDQRRVWLRPGLEETARAALTRAAMAMLVAGPLTADADDLNQ